MSYTFTKVITKQVAFSAYLSDLFPLPLTVSTDGDQITITSAEVLSSENETLLTTLVDSYTDPAEFLVLDHTESLAGVSAKTNSVTPFDVQSVIFPGTSSSGNGSVMDSIKFILKLSTNDVSLAGGLTGPVHIQIYDTSRSVEIASLDINVDTVWSEWDTAFQNGETGMKCNYKSVFVGDLRNNFPDYDCIWIFRVNVPSDVVFARLDSLQRLYYTIL